MLYDARFTWNPVSGAEGYHLYLEGYGGIDGDIIPADPSSPSITQQLNLEPDTEYTFEISAYDPRGEGPRASRTVRTPAMPVPGGSTLDVSLIVLGGGVAGAPGQGLLNTVSGEWGSLSYAAQSSVFKVVTSVRPGQSNTDLVVALADTETTGYPENSCLVRFSSSGEIEAYNGSDYLSDATIPYSENETYEVEFRVNTARRVYDVLIDGVYLANGYAFRATPAGAFGFLNVIEQGSGGSSILGLASGSYDYPGSPAQVTGLSLSPLATSISLSWIAGDEIDLAEYRVYRSDDGASFSLLGSTPASSYNDTGLSEETQYWYYVEAVDASGNVSIPSDTETISTQASAGQAPTTNQSSVSKDGITWTFDQAYPVGQYVNGDYFVVGPATVTNINTGSYSSSFAKNGSEINPNDALLHGFTDDNDKYSSALNVALSLPFGISPGDSLVSTHGRSTASGPRTHIEVAAVLTCVSAAPSALSFRPPYCGTSKPEYLFNESVVTNWPTVDDSSKPQSGLSLSEALDRTKRLQLEPAGRYGIDNDRLHPRINMENWGANIGRVQSDAILQTFLQSVSEADRRSLIIGIAQGGIDNYHAKVENYFRQSDATGGIGNGRRVGVTFAGAVLERATGDRTIIDCFSNGTFSVYTDNFPSTYSPGVLHNSSTFQDDSQYIRLNQALRDAANNPDDYSSFQDYWYVGVFDGVPLGEVVWAAKGSGQFAGWPSDARYAGATPDAVNVATTMMYQLLGLTAAEIGNIGIVEVTDNAHADLYTTWGAAGTVSAGGGSGFVYRDLKSTTAQEQFLTDFRIP